MEHPSIGQATEALVNAIRESEEYKAYQSLKEAVMADDTTKALLKEYQRLQAELQMAAVAGQEANDDAVEKFTKLSELLYMNQEAAGYLLAQMRVQKLAGEVIQRVADAAGLEMPGM